MSATFDFERLLHSTLDESGPTTAPPRLVDASIARAGGVSQRRPLVSVFDRRAWPAGRLRLGNPGTAIPVATIAIVALIMLGLLAVLAVGRSLERPAPLPVTPAPLPVTPAPLPVAPAPLPAKPAPLPVRPATIMVQQWNGLRDPDSIVSHKAFEPGSAVGSPAMEVLPPNAVGLRWSADGTRLAYWERDAPPDQHSLELRALYLARADGTAPVPVALPRETNVYVSNGWWSGVRWAPTGDRFALAWDTGGCSDGPDCTPPGGIDVFDLTGQLVAAISVSDSVGGDVLWAPDGLTVGWTTGSCSDSYCESDALHLRQLDEAASVTTLPLDRGSSVVWSDANRLLVVVERSERDGTGDEVVVMTAVDRVYSMAPDGSDIRESAWAPDADVLGPVWSPAPIWSPDGRSLATLDAQTGDLTIGDAVSGTELRANVPPGIDFAAWSPDSDRLLMFGMNEAPPQAYHFFVISADGTGFTSLGDGDDFGWMPSPTAAAP